jgi:hypothetical protein
MHLSVTLNVCCLSYF